MQQTAISVSNIQPGRNPRTFFDPAEMAELTESVRVKGVIQPILVRPVTDGKFEIVAGERRWRAAMSAHGESYQIPVMVSEMNDEEADEASLIENIQRANMSPGEEAVAASKILGRCQGDRDEAARRLGWSRTTLDKRLALMNCAETVISALNERKIQLGHAELLAAVTKDKQNTVLAKLLEKTPVPSVGDLKSMLAQIACSLESAIFDKADCAGCSHNSSLQGSMFSEAIAAGNCTNGECFSKKSDEALAAKAETLKDEYPVVRIVRAGENFTLLPLRAEGATGVGDEQAKACHACSNYGAAISAVPGKIGNVYKDLCFDAACNSKKVAERIKSEKAAAEKPAAPGKPDAKPKQQQATKDASAPKAAVQDSNRVKDYRVGVWRAALRYDLMANPAKNLIALVVLGLSGNASKINSSKLCDALGKLTSKQVGHAEKVDDLANMLEGAGEEVITKMHQGMMATATAGIEERTLIQYLDWMKVDLAAHWKLNEKYLGLLTKSEMEVIADEIGLKAAVGEKFSKLMSGKKEEIIKSLLNVEGFDYQGKVPGNMRWAA